MKTKKRLRSVCGRCFVDPLGDGVRGDGVRGGSGEACCWTGQDSVSSVASLLPAGRHKQQHISKHQQTSKQQQTNKQQAWSIMINTWYCSLSFFAFL